MSGMEFMQRTMSPEFITPDLESEAGEINNSWQRILYDESVPATIKSSFQNKFSNNDQFIKSFNDLASMTTNLSELDSNIWQRLQNTDSFDINIGDFKGIQEHINGAGLERDWKYLTNRMVKGSKFYAPIILKYKNMYYLVSGNTRLMCARVLGITPKVFIVDMSPSQSV